MPTSKVLGVLLSGLLVSACRSSPTDGGADAAFQSLGPGFVSGRVSANGTTLYYVRGGSGPPVILLHGFPEDWSAWHRVMPPLSRRFDVVAVDLRGIGRSAPARSGFDIATMAEDVYQLAQRLELERPVIAGHDVGGMVAYAFPLLHPEGSRGIVFIESLVPDVDPWAELKASPEMWHFGFLQTERLAHQLLLGREAVFVREFVRSAMADPAALSDADVDRYARAYAGVDHLRAALGFYRAFPEDEGFIAQHRGPVDVPLAVIASEGGFAPLLPKMVEAFNAKGWAEVTSDVVANSVHYILDEQPEAVARLIEQHASAWTTR